MMFLMFGMICLKMLLVVKFYIMNLFEIDIKYFLLDVVLILKGVKGWFFKEYCNGLLGVWR